jgi:hypothetical protein
MKRCSRCIRPRSAFDTRLDADGICNHCRDWENVGPLLTDFSRWGKVFEKKLDRVRGKFEFDVMVGISGGKDGAYLAYMLKEKFGLRVLALTIHYGFMPNEQAQQNAARVVEQLGLPHVHLRVPEPVVRKLFRSYMGGLLGFPLPCLMCTYILGPALVAKAAIEHRVPLIIWGLDRGQLFARLTEKKSRCAIYDQLVAFDPAAARIRQEAGLKKIGAMLSKLGLSASERSTIMPAGPTLEGTDLVPEQLRYYLFHVYDEVMIKQTIQTHAGWVPPDGDALRGHFDCELKKAVSYTYPAMGICSPLEWELSVDIREGKITREAAMERVAAERTRALSCERPYEAYQQYFGLSERAFAGKIRALRAIAPAWLQAASQAERFCRAMRPAPDPLAALME